MKKLILPLFALLAATVCAQAPSGYYKTLEGKKEGELKTAIYELVRNFRQVSSYNALPDYFLRTDVRPGTNYWWDMYSDMDVSTSIRFGTYMNREHSFPKSWWGGSTSVSAYVDLNHLYPAEAKANQEKSNYPLGEVDLGSGGEVKFKNGVTTVGKPVTGQGGGAKYVFEPPREYKGDFARTYFYMVTCYQNLTWDKKYDWMMSQDLYPTLNNWAISLLLRWHREDPVSEKEFNRNNEVFKIQNNRNPFIDRPELAEYLWGNKKGLAYKSDTPDVPTGDPELFTPVQNMSLDFNQVAEGGSVRSQLYFHGANLTGTLDIVLTGADRAMFSIGSRSIPAQAVNSENGYLLDVTYTPTALGNHQARLVVSEGGLIGSRGIALIGECLPVPVLTACTALPASDITPDSYTANWTYPENETVDYWIITRQMYRGGTMTSEEILAESPGWPVEGFSDNDSEAYSVQSVRLGHRSPASNIIFIDHAGVTGVEADRPLIVQGFDGLMRFVCSAAHTGVRVYDLAGILVASLDTVNPNDELSIAPGAYFVLTDQCTVPVKVIVR